MSVQKTESIFKGTLPQLIAVLAACMTALSDGMQYGWSAPAVPIYLGPNSPIPISKEEAEWLETIIWIGAFIGIFITMYLVNKIGRKKTILIAAFVSILVWITMALLAARLVSGIVGNVAFVAGPMYIAEVAHQKIRGFLSGFIYLNALIGIFIVYTTIPYINLYVPCIIGAIATGFQLVVFSFMPESPYYLVFKNRDQEAKIALQKLRSADYDVDKELEDIKVAVRRQQEERGRIQDMILVPSNRKAVIIMTVLNFVQHFSSVSVLLMNLHSVLEAAGSIYLDPSLTGLVFSLIMILAAFSGMFTIDKFGRRTMLMASSILAGLSLSALALYFGFKSRGFDVASISWIPIVSVMIYAFVFKFGLGLVPIVLTAEIFSTKMKAYGMTYADGVYQVGAVISLQVYQRLLDAFGIEYPFYVFSVCCFSASVFTYFYIPETKGKSLEQIQMLLKGNIDEDRSQRNEQRF